MRNVLWSAIWVVSFFPVQAYAENFRSHGTTASTATSSHPVADISTGYYGAPTGYPYTSPGYNSYPTTYGYPYTSPGYTTPYTGYNMGYTTPYYGSMYPTTGYPYTNFNNYGVYSLPYSGYPMNTGYNMGYNTNYGMGYGGYGMGYGMPMSSPYMMAPQRPIVSQGPAGYNNSGSSIWSSPTVWQRNFSYPVTYGMGYNNYSNYDLYSGYNSYSNYDLYGGYTSAYDACIYSYSCGYSSGGFAFGLDMGNWGFGFGWGN